MARFVLLAVACLSSAVALTAPRPHTAACKQRLATPPRGTVVASLGVGDAAGVVAAVGVEAADHGVDVVDRRADAEPDEA